MTYGPNTATVQAIIDRIPTLTEDECKRLNAAWSAAWSAAWIGSWIGSWDAAWDAARDAAWDATWDATWNAAWDAAWDAARDAARDAIVATVTYDLATETGPYTIAQRDLLLAPWVKVCGMPDGLVTP